ncbi:MAG: DUF2341 domain-containing protein [Candidatus Sumerlaeota bacterium]|nr:DUF2341 domain-containing protein [Candidatus Sumerlaeota bacterium]
MLKANRILWGFSPLILITLLLCPVIRSGAAEDKPANASAQYQGWQHSGSIFILTTPEGANLPASASEDGFPLLVRLHKDFFDFSQAKANGEDIRFSASAGAPLAYQIDEWDASNGTAAIWVRIPTLKGAARQEIKLHWGKSDAAGESSGPAVFNESNGYLSVWHMDDPVKDEVGVLKSKDTGTISSSGIIGKCRRLIEGKGINCGENIATYPSGSSPHSSEAWFRAEKPNATILGWGNEQAQGKVIMQFVSPPHIRMDCYFSGANVTGGSALATSQWIHVIHTFKSGDSRIYVNGILDGVSTSLGAPLAIKSPARMYIGGWYNNYRFDGDIDEARISKVTRSADWVKLQYENQKPLQTLVGPLMQLGDAFSVSQTQMTVLEGKTATVAAKAGGAQKLYWILKADGREAVAAVDRLSYTFDAGRVNGDKSLTLQFKAVCANEVKIKDIPIMVKEDIQEPVFTLKSPATWDARETIEVTPQIANLREMQAKGAGQLKYVWTVSDIAVIKETAPDKLILRRAQNSGNMTVALALSNGGAEVTAATTITVKEPTKDAWIQRTPAKDEKPEDNQFYARDDNNEGTLYYNGALNEAADSVFLKVYAGDQLYKNESSKLSSDKAYAFSIKLKPGLIKYKVEFGSKSGDRETLLHTASNLVCGDAYLINGQSNAVAADFGKEDPAFRSEWIRTFGSMSGSPKGVRVWGNAMHRSRDAEKLQIGYWAMELGRRLVENHQIPICIINGAVGGTRIDQHQRNPQNPQDMATIYGRLLWRVEQARLTHGIRGVFWHQGENDQGADGPDGGFGWETYRKYFIDLAAAWKQDYPNIQHYYIFQIWPKSCSMGFNGSDNMLREAQRTLPSWFSNLSIMSTLGIKPAGTCHYPAAGYAEMARLICPLVERDNYGKVFDKPVTPANLKSAFYTSDKKDEIALEFDQPMAWNNSLASQFYLDGAKGGVAEGAALEKLIILKLKPSSTAQKITYLDSASWSIDNLLCGENGIAALTFCNVPLLPR